MYRLFRIALLSYEESQQNRDSNFLVFYLVFVFKSNLCTIMYLTKIRFKRLCRFAVQLRDIDTFPGAITGKMICLPSEKRLFYKERICSQREKEYKERICSQREQILSLLSRRFCTRGLVCAKVVSLGVNGRKTVICI